MENTTANNFKQKLWLETKDILSSVAFPFIIMLIFSASLISFSYFEMELGLRILILILGEISLAAAYVVFGKQNGLHGVRNTAFNQRKLDMGSDDKKAVLRIGEYAVYKGFLIGFISCVPFIIFQFIQCLAPNTFCDFIIKYAFSWASSPFAMASLSPWFNFLSVIVLVAIHGVAYIFGGRKERINQTRIAEVQENQKGKKKKK